MVRKTYDNRTKNHDIIVSTKRNTRLPQRLAAGKLVTAVPN